MHEMGIALQIIEIATDSIPKKLKASKVARVNLKLGKLAAVVAESLRFCFEVASKETALEGAELAIEEIPVLARCQDCKAEWTITEPAFSCPACESGALEILSGRELDIESIEIAAKDEQNDANGD